MSIGLVFAQTSAQLPNLGLECIIKRHCPEVLLKTANLWPILTVHTDP